MAQLNPFEARMKIGDAIMDVLADLTVDGEEYTEEDLLDVEEAMSGVADLILQVLDLQVVRVEDDGRIVCELSLEEVVDETTT